MASVNSLITRNYSNFRGVDFTNGLVSKYRSPDALNMWKNYLDDDCIQTRPGMELIGEFDYEIFGLFFYKVNNNTKVLVHSGTKLYLWNNYPNTPVNRTELYTGLNIAKSRGFVYDSVFFFMDGINYLEYDGQTIKEVEGTIPTTSYWKNPDGSTNLDSSTDNEYVYQDVNCLTGVRKNTFIGDGTSTIYKLDIYDLDANYAVVATVDGTTILENQGLTVDRAKGWITFNDAPVKDAKVIIQFSRTASGYRERILNCTMCVEFDNRIFFSGNPDYPNAVFHCELNDPRYVRDTAYYEMGINLAPVKAIIPGNNVLWVIKDIDQNSGSVFYMTPTITGAYGYDYKSYPSVSGNIAVGCVSTGLNFNDDIVFFSELGLEGISSGSLYSEQLLQHRSSMVDIKLVNEPSYTNIKLAEWQGYLIILADNHVYLADKRQKFSENTDIGYEWFYWELPMVMNDVIEYRNNLFFTTSDGKIFKVGGTTDNGEPIESYWTTKKDDFDAPSYTKTTNKKGGTLSFKKTGNDDISITSILDGVEKKTKVLVDSKGYGVYKVKNKKFKEIQFKISSNKPFGLFSMTIEGFIAGYVKR